MASNRSSKGFWNEEQWPDRLYGGFGLEKRLSLLRYTTSFEETVWTTLGHILLEKEPQLSYPLALPWRPNSLLFITDVNGSLSVSLVIKCNTMVGWSVCGLCNNDPEFALLPPFFLQLIDLVDSAKIFCFPNFGRHLHKIAKICLALVVYHRRFLRQTLPARHLELVVHRKASSWWFAKTCLLSFD